MHRFGERAHVFSRLPLFFETLQQNHFINKRVALVSEFQSKATNLVQKVETIFKIF